MNRYQFVASKAYCAHGFPPLLCNTCSVQAACVHGMVRDCLLCSKQGLDSWFGKESVVPMGGFVQANGNTPSRYGARADASSLRLGINERYRSAILLASQRTGLDPAGIAAVINAEAAPLSNNKIKEKLADEVFRLNNPGRDWDKRPLDTKDPADAPLIKAWKALFTGTAWDEKSYNPTGASGLTQFLAGTWLDEVKRPATYLHDFAQDSGYLDQKGEVIASKQSKLLDLRYEPTLSIVAAAEYDKCMLGKVIDSLSRDTSEVDKIFFSRHPERDFSKNRLKNPGDVDLIKEWKQIFDAHPGKPPLAIDLTGDKKARYLYLCHHEGDKGAIQVLNGSLTDSQAKNLLRWNVEGEDRRAALVKEHGSESKAYIHWLWSYIDQHIQPSGFRA